MTADLFAGQIRSSGKTFLEHLVGTASAVAAVGGRPPSSTPRCSTRPSTCSSRDTRSSSTRRSGCQSSRSKKPPACARRSSLNRCAWPVLLVASALSHKNARAAFLKTKRNAVKQLGKVTRERHEVRRALERDRPSRACPPRSLGGCRAVVGAHWTSFRSSTDVLAAVWRCDVGRRSSRGAKVRFGIALLAGSRRLWTSLYETSRMVVSPTSLHQRLGRRRRRAAAPHLRRLRRLSRDCRTSENSAVCFEATAMARHRSSAIQCSRGRSLTRAHRTRGSPRRVLSPRSLHARSK